jgi:hypothetical protein
LHSTHRHRSPLRHDFRAETVAGDPFVKNAEPAPAGAEEFQWKNAVLVLEVYALPKGDALAILESERGSAARYQRVLDLAKTKKARLEILTALTTKSGNRAVTESIDEVRYPTEFEPGAAKGAPAVASAFETRNVGDTLEFELVIGPDGHTCDLSLVPARVSLAGFRELAAAPGDPAVARPRFTSQRLTTNTTLESDDPHYLGTFTPPSENGIADGAAAEIWLTFLRVHVHGPAAGEVKPPAKPFNWGALNLEYSVYSLDGRRLVKSSSPCRRSKRPGKSSRACFGTSRRGSNTLWRLRPSRGKGRLTRKATNSDTCPNIRHRDTRGRPKRPTAAQRRSRGWILVTTRKRRKPPRRPRQRPSNATSRMAMARPAHQARSKLAASA